jgi:hypothetical protein
MGFFMAKRIEPRRRLRRRVDGAAVLLAAVAGVWVLPPQAADAYSVRSSGVTHHRSEESEDTLQLTISDSGFEPTQVTRGPGKFLVTTDDRRGDRSQSLKLRLSRENGEHLRDIEVPVAATDWAEELELAVGRYVLSEVSHPTWSCNIVIE